jgi:hypothetical protein
MTTPTRQRGSLQTGDGVPGGLRVTFPDGRSATVNFDVQRHGTPPRDQVAGLSINYGSREFDVLPRINPATGRY